MWVLGEENKVLNKSFEVIHMKKGRLSRDLKEVGEQSRKIMPGGSLLAMIVR